MPEGAMEEYGHVERVRVVAIHGEVDAGTVEVEGEDRKEHDCEPHVGEDQKLEGRIPTVWPAPDPDQEEHREQDELPEDREEEEIEGHEDACEGHLQEEEEAEERARPILLVPVEHDRQGREERGEPDERDAQAVYADDVVKPELGDPSVSFHVEQRDVRAGRGRRGRGRRPEEHSPARIDETEEEERRERGLDQAEGESDPLRQALGRPDGPGDDRADKRDDDEEGEDVRHLIDLDLPTSAGGSSSQT